jgi:hypothetical protein
MKTEFQWTLDSLSIRVRHHDGKHTAMLPPACCIKYTEESQGLLQGRVREGQLAQKGGRPPRHKDGISQSALMITT